MSLHQPILVLHSARVLHQPPMSELLPDVSEDFTRDVRRRLDYMYPTVEPEQQREPSASSLDGLSASSLDGLWEELVSEVRRRLDGVDRVLLNVVQRVENLEGRRETDARDRVDRALLNVVQLVKNLEGRRETDAVFTCHMRDALMCALCIVQKVVRRLPEHQVGLAEDSAVFRFD